MVNTFTLSCNLILMIHIYILVTVFLSVKKLHLLNLIITCISNLFIRLD